MASKKRPEVGTEKKEAGSVIHRRQFIRQSSGLLVAGLGSVACGGDGSPITKIDPAQSGTIQFTITGLPAGATDFGSASTTVSGNPASIPLTSAVGTLPGVPVGTYSVLYTAPAGYQVDGAATKTLSVTVTANTTTAVGVTDTLIVAQGTIRVTVSGLTVAATAGGSVSLQRKDIAGTSPIVVNVPASGIATDTLVTVGTYDVTYTSPTGFHLSGTDATNTGATHLYAAQVVTVNATTVVAVPVMPAGKAGDLADFGFDDGTSGPFVSSSVLPFLTIPGAVWSIDSTTVAARGTNSVKQVYPASGGNVGGAFFNLFSARTNVYVRVMYRQSDPFNKNGTTNNYDQVKLIRLLGPGFTGQIGSVFISNSLASSPGVLLGTFADLEGNVQHVPNLNLPAPNMNDFVGKWVCIEAHWDITNNNALHFEAWINGTQTHDYTIAQPNLSRTYGVVQFDGTINSMQQDSTVWFDQLGVSSQYMGVP